MGVLITPPDGQVYYTGDAESFIDGSAKTDGHYFYVDSDSNNFYETVYILSETHATARDGTPKYNVMSIGQNNDGIHDFAPYERLDIEEISVTNFDNLAMESARFGTDWVYNFDKLSKVGILWDQESPLEEYGLKPKDNIFEIYKLAEMSEQKSKFPKLFYEIRHETYSNAWDQYEKQLIKDIASQTFMAVTAGVLSAFVETSMTAASLGFGWLGAHGTAMLVYFAVYTLMTKISIDVKLHESKAISRSGIFYSVSDGVNDPTSLNEKSFADRFLQDSMTAALLGHPGGYYTTVTGGSPGNMYEGNLLVSPPRFGRLGDTNWLDDAGGFLRLLSDNLLDMGKSDPDAFTALDFDDTNLNYLLLTSELPSYNRYDYYTYYNTNDDASMYDAYSTNTLGFLESKIKRISNNRFDAIQPTIINGVPSYNFINSTLYQAVLPQSILYKPVVLSEERYNQVDPVSGLLIITVQCKDYGATKGIDPYIMTSIERQTDYKAKIPLNNKGFEYPIKTISITIISESTMGDKSYLRRIQVDESYYTIEDGNLYFTKSLEEIISETYPESEYSGPIGLTGAYMYYDINIVFDRFVRDDSDERSSLALAQATFYTIMDYFNQYTYAQVSANMIGEIAYTETLTFWSTLISAPLIYFGSALADKAVGNLAGEAGVILIKEAIQSAVNEVFQEIIIDGVIEALAENVVEMLGGSEDLGFWVATIATSLRETAMGPLKTFVGGQLTNLKTKLTLMAARSSGDANTALQTQETIKEASEQANTAELEAGKKMSTWKKLLKSGFFKGIFMLSTSIFFGMTSFTILSTFKNTIEVSVKLDGMSKARTQAYRKGLVQHITKDHSTLAENLESQMKKPKNLKQEELNKLFRNLQKDGKIDTPSIQRAPQINPNPKATPELTLAERFEDIRLGSWINELSPDYRFKDFKEKMEAIRKNSDIIEFTKKVDLIRKEIKSALDSYPTLLRYMDYTGIVLYDPNHIGFGFRLGPNPNSKIIDNMEFQEDFAEALTTEEYAIELEKAYDVRIKLQVCLYQNGKLILMPRGTQSHSEWLSTQNYNKMADKIVLMPKDEVSALSNKFLPKYSQGMWDNYKTSPYFAELKLFFEQIEASLKYHKVIKKRSDIDKILKLDKRTSNYKTIDQDIYSLNEKTPSGEKSYGTVTWNKLEGTLNTWLVRFLNEIETSPKTYDKDGARQSITELFEHYYKISGYTYKHPLYRSAKLALSYTIEILLDTGVLKSFSIEELDGLLISAWEKGLMLKKPGPCTSLYITLASTPTNRPLPSVSEKLRDNIIIAARGVSGTTFSLSDADRIKRLFAAHIENLIDFRASGDILGRYEKSYRSQLLQSLIDQNKPLRRVLAIKEEYFVHLLFGHTYHSLSTPFLSPSRTNIRPLKLFDMIDRSYSWSTQTFKDLGVIVSYNELKEMRINIKETIFDWMINARYSKPLINGKLFRSDKPVVPELGLIVSLLVAARRKANNPDLSLDNIATLQVFKDVKSSISSNLKSGSKFSSNTLKIFQKTIQDWMGQEINEKSTFDKRKMVSYQIALNEISYYARFRRRTLEGKIKTRTPSNRGDFDKDQAKIYNVILGLGRHIGFDPGFFRPVEDQMFDMNKGVKQMFKDLGKKLWIYVRHHFRNNPNRASIAITDQIVVDSRSHAFWEATMNEDAASASVQVLEALIKYDRRIKESDIRNEFAKFGGKYDWIMANWISQPNFADNLDKFNDRKDDIKSMSIMDFINIHYPLTYDKFIMKLLKTQRVNVRDIIQAMHPNVDISQLVNIGTNDGYIGPYSTVFEEILKMYSYPVHL